MPVKTEWTRYADQLGYLAVPDRATTPLPGVVIIHDALGLDDHTEDLTRRISSAGYAALAPDLYCVGGTRPASLSRERITETITFFSRLRASAHSDGAAVEVELSSLPEPARSHIKETLARMTALARPDALARFMAPLRRAVHYLRVERAETNGQKVACMGEGLSALLACEEPELSGAVVFYGSTPPLDRLSEIHCPILAFYAANDPNINAGIPELERAARAAGKAFEHHIYEDAAHGFFNDATSSYNVPAARRSFARMMGFLLETLS